MNTLIKYPRTPHLPFSLGFTSDDKVLKNTEHFKNKQIVITEKMDGENTTIYSDNYHARSLDSKHQDYHSYLLSCILPSIQYKIQENWRICGEYLYAKHSILYENLEDYFLVFSVWNEKNECISWEKTKEYIDLLGLKLVPELYIGIYDEKIVKEIAKEVVKKGGEGIVVRNTSSFSYENFNKNIAKFVRENHVQTNKNWTFQQIIKNELLTT